MVASVSAILGMVLLTDDDIPTNYLTGTGGAILTGWNGVNNVQDVTLFAQAVVTPAGVTGGDGWTRNELEAWLRKLRRLEEEVEGKKRLDREDAENIMELVNTATYGVSPVPVQTIRAEVSQLLAEPPKVKQYDGQFGFGDVTIAKVMGQLREYEARMREEAMTREEVSLLDFLMMQ